MTEEVDSGYTPTRPAGVTAEVEQFIIREIEKRIKTLNQYAQVPYGGTNGQMLTKSSDRPYEMAWATPASGVYVTDGDKGDVTVSGTGTTWTIDNGAVTLAKMANMTTARVLGRTTAGSGAPEELSAGYGLTFASGAVTAALSYATSALSADVNFAANNTWYDGPSISLAAGTWLVIAHASMTRANTAAIARPTARITDGTNHYASGHAYTESAVAQDSTVSISAIITLASTTTIKLQGAAASVSTNSYMLAATSVNGSGNNASRISAIRIA